MLWRSFPLKQSEQDREITEDFFFITSSEIYTHLFSQEKKKKIKYFFCVLGKGHHLHTTAEIENALTPPPARPLTLTPLAFFSRVFWGGNQDTEPKK